MAAILSGVGSEPTLCLLIVDVQTSLDSRLSAGTEMTRFLPEGFPSQRASYAESVPCHDVSRREIIWLFHINGVALWATLCELDGR